MHGRNNKTHNTVNQAARNITHTPTHPGLLRYTADPTQTCCCLLTKANDCTWMCKAQPLLDTDCLIKPQTAKPMHASNHTNTRQGAAQCSSVPTSLARDILPSSWCLDSSQCTQQTTRQTTTRCCSTHTRLAPTAPAATTTTQQRECLVS